MKLSARLNSLIVYIIMYEERSQRAEIKIADSAVKPKVRDFSQGKGFAKRELSLMNLRYLG